MTKEDLQTLAAMFERRAAERIAEGRLVSGGILQLIADVLADRELSDIRIEQKD